MAARDENDDVRAIRALIGAHFRGLQWTPGTRADWPAFAADFVPDASLFPAARPVRRQSVDAFIARMDSLARDKLRSFEETMLGMEILVFGTVAVVLGASEMVENGTEVNRDVSGFLLIKDEGKWSIAAHAWDHETPTMPVPEHLRHT
jgi:peptidoglycan/xylan/chitin deacetylase (PgdA/CDA1 family)